MSGFRTFDDKPTDRDLGPTVLIADDDEMMRDRFKTILQGSEFASEIQVLESTDIPSTLAILSSTPVHVLLLDKHFGQDLADPTTNGIEHIPEFLEIQPHLQILVVTSSNVVKDIVHAMKSGARNYVLKEEDDELVLQHIEKLITGAKLRIDKERIERGQRPAALNFIGESCAARKLLQQVEAVAETNLPVLLLGETGTGKTTLAHHVHELRKRFLKQEERAFFAVNLSAMSPTLLEAELFGYEKGAFTGAHRTKQGFFELANKGTLFLDEIGEVSLETQKKLLTVLEDGTFYRLGSSRLLHSSFKLVCATNQNLDALVKAKKFREDLYMRISTFTLQVPNIAERKEDLPGILRSLLPKCCAENGLTIDFEDLPKDFIRAMCENPPPGNIRGLKNQLARLLVFSPRDHRGRPLLSRWRNIPGLSMTPVESAPGYRKLSFKDLRDARLDVITDDFPGLNPFIDLIEEKVFQEARQKFPKATQIAKALRISDTTVSNRLKRFQAASRGTFVTREMGQSQVERGRA